MKTFPTIRQINHIAAILSGIFIFVISFLCFYETVARNVFSKPTTWTLDVSTYLLIWVFFLATAAALQEKSHVSVDFIREIITRRFSKLLGRTLAIAGYLFSLVYVLVLLGTTIQFIRDALRLNKLTLAVIQIPVVYLYFAIVVGCILTVLAIISIILDLLRNGDRYL